MKKLSPEQCRILCGRLVPRDASPVTGLRQRRIPKGLLASEYRGESVQPRRASIDLISSSHATPCYRSVWSVFGDSKGLSGLVQPLDY